MWLGLGFARDLGEELVAGERAAALDARVREARATRTQHQGPRRAGDVPPVEGCQQQVATRDGRAAHRLVPAVAAVGHLELAVGRPTETHAALGDTVRERHAVRVARLHFEAKRLARRRMRRCSGQHGVPPRLVRARRNGTRTALHRTVTPQLGTESELS